MPAEGKGAAAAQEVGSEEDASKSASPFSMSSNSLRNRAGESNSLYVQAHADTPVAWQLLDDDAIGRAKKENKLIFLNIGFRACHYCRLTTQDSFSNPAVANILNESFIPIIVDREERPDIDAVYQNYIQAINGAGGWPLNVFLTPELEPVFGGTYWPGPGAEHSRPAIGGATTALGGRGAVSATAASSDTEDEDRLDFLVILKKLRKIWTEQETRCRKEAKEILLQLRDFAAEGTLGSRGVGAPAASGKVSAAEPVDTVQSGGTYVAPLNEGLDIDLDQLEEAYSRIARTFDAINGGFGIEPKFPTPSKLSFLLRLGQYPQAVRDVVGEKEVEHADFMARHTLRRLRDGGLRDHVGQGFARYSVTADWAMPHFEKMVADNALLLDLYLDAWLSGAKDGKLSLDDEFADIVLELVDYLTSKPIRLMGGGFATSEAADSYYRKGDQHMHEGAYYLWTRKEFDAVVGKDDETERAATIAAAYWNVLEHGNIPREQDPQDEFINQNVLHVIKDIGEISKQFGIPEQQVKEVIAQARKRLRAHREKERVRSETDDNFIAAYNGMVIGALSRAFGALLMLDPGRASLAFDAANEAAELLQRDYWDASAKVLYRTKGRDGKGTKGFADDYAFVIDGLLQLVELSSAQDRWLKWANELQEAQISQFYDRDVSPGRPKPRAASGAFFSTPEGDPQVILRLKDGMDTAQPSTNAVSASNLFRLRAALGDPGSTNYGKMARETIAAFEAEILQYPWLFVGLLSSVVYAQLGGTSAIILGKEIEDEKTEKFNMEWYLKPRATPRVLLFVPAEGETWLLTKNEGLRHLQEGNRKRPGVYAIKDDNGVQSIESWK